MRNLAPRDENADVPIKSDVDAKAADNAVVKLTGNQTVAGTKTFSASPVVPTPTGATDAATKGYVDGADSVLPAVTEAATNRTLQLSDAGKVVECTNSSVTTVTVPPHSSVAFPIGTVVNVYAAGAGGVTIFAGSGVTIRRVASLTQYRECSLRKRADNEWVQVG